MSIGRGNSSKSPISPFFVSRSINNRTSKQENGNLDDFETVSGKPVAGYQKIAGAVEALRFNFRGKTVLDIGSSTGGFTAYALERGAAKVIAVEKGTRQMQAPLRCDPRVELHEKTDIFDFKLSIYPDAIVADVSFLSLTKVLMYAKMELAQAATEFLVMCKPQFEAEPWQLNRGVVKNEKMRREILKKFEFWLKQHGFIILAKHDNELRGKNGNRERFYHLKLAI